MMNTMRRYRPLIAIAALLLVGSLAVLAAPSGDAPTPNAAQSAFTGNTATTGATTPATQTSATPGHRNAAPNVTTPGATPTDTPTPDPNTTATATPTDTPTATPVPPTPTPTPVPTWHTLTTFSGDGAADLGTITPAYPWRLTYTCVYTGHTQDFLVPYPRDGRTDYPIAYCDPSADSGVLSDGAGWPAPAGSYSLSVIAATPSNGIPAWTLSVEVWY